MKIKTRAAADIEPVFGILRDGWLVFPKNGGDLRIVAAGDGEVVDARKSALWITRDGGSAFAEFFEAHFSVNMSNGAPRERFIAAGYRELFRREFPCDELKTPEYHGNGLVRCPHCGRIFRPLSFLGVIRCNDRECLRDMNNPFYDPRRIKESIEWGRLDHLAECRGLYYCPKTRRYYPKPPSRAALWCEFFAEWVRDRTQGRGK